MSAKPFNILFLVYISFSGLKICLCAHERPNHIQKAKSVRIPIYMWTKAQSNDHIAIRPDEQGFISIMCVCSRNTSRAVAHAEQGDTETGINKYWIKDKFFLRMLECIWFNQRRVRLLRLLANIYFLKYVQGPDVISAGIIITWIRWLQAELMWHKRRHFAV